MATKRKDEQEPLKDIFEQFPPDVIRKSIPTLIRLACLPPDRKSSVDPCTTTCAQVRRSIENLAIDITEASGDCGSTPVKMIAESIVRQEWEYGWTDDARNNCGGRESRCKCGADGEGSVVDKYQETRMYDEDLQPNCKLRFTAKFTVTKYRRTGECRPL